MREATGAISVYGFIPVRTASRQQYKTLANPRTVKIALGIVFFGSLTSSLSTQTASHPMKLKTASVDPLKIPDAGNGKNGW